MADDFAALNRKLGEFAARLEGPPMRQVAMRVAVRAKRVATDAIAQDVGADMRMSNWHRGRGEGVKLGVGFDLVSDHEVRMRPRPSGPAKTLEDGSLPHAIESKGSKITGRGAASRRAARSIARATGARGGFSGSRAMPTPNGFAYRVKHRGSKGKRTWSRAVRDVDGKVAGWVSDEVGTVLSRVLD